MEYYLAQTVTVMVNPLPIITITTASLPDSGLVMQAESFNIIAMLFSSNVSNQTIAYTDLSTYGIIITPNPSPCTLYNDTDSPSSSCTFTVTPVWNVAIPGSYTINLTNSGVGY